jgi:predicted RND superfamily exporter protein
MVAVNGAAIAYIKVPKDITASERVALAESITAAVPDALVTGWSQALVSLIPWAQHELITFGSAVAVIVLALLGVLYRNTRFWLLHIVSLLAAGAGTVATLKLFNLPINLLNVLAFPLMLGVGVDYGTHIILAVCEKGDTEENLAGVVKAIALSGLTTAAGFGALILARNPALSGLGALCGIGVIWCLLAAIFIVCPAAAALRRK